MKLKRKLKPCGLWIGTRQRAVAAALLLLPAFFALSCGQTPPGKGAGEIGSAGANSIAANANGENTNPVNAQPGTVRFRIETVAGNLEVPWSIVFAPDGRMLFTERPGRIRVIEDGRLRPVPLAVIQDVEPTGESGLMGLALHPQFAQNRQLYLAYAYQRAAGQSGSRSENSRRR
jgi:glucose/arabinose dehydrogenase